MQEPFALIGHGARWNALRRAFASGRVPQTLLISGAAHVGKWTLVRAWAQLLLCPHAMENLVGGLPLPCLKCRVCHQVEVETFPDLRVVRPIISKSNPQRAPEALDSSSIPIDEARRFVDEAAYRPTVGERKVMIVYQADRLAEDAQATLLKTLEEPGTGVRIVLATERPLELLATVRSRCWQVRLGLAPAREIESWLQREMPGLAPRFLEAAVVAAAGRPGLAWRVATQLSEAKVGDAPPAPRREQVLALIKRVQSATPWGFLALSESAQKLAESWGAEDAIARTEGEDGAENKQLARTLVRSQLARFLDELSAGYRARWIQDLALFNGQETGAADRGARAEVWAAGLDRIGKTRHYILRNANASLALDVLFAQLVQDQARSQAPPRRERANERDTARRTAST
jgi:DNA polymerase-3 subunit delta'